MLFGGGSGDIPDLLKPAVEFIFGYLACFALGLRRLSVPPWLALHEDEFHVVLDDGVGFIRLAQEFGAVRHFIGGISDFVPDDGIQIVKANPSADNTDIGVKGKYEVSPEIASGHADIADHANQSSTGDKNTKSMPPDLFQLAKKRLVILNVPQLIGILIVLLEIPVRGGGNDEVEGFIVKEG